MTVKSDDPLLNVQATCRTAKAEAREAADDHHEHPGESSLDIGSSGPL